MHFVSSWIVRRILAANAEYSLNIHYLMERFSAARCQLIREFWAFFAPAITRARRQKYSGDRARITMDRSFASEK